MAYVTSFERFAIERGMKQGLEQGIEISRQEGRLKAIREIISNMLGIGIKKKTLQKL